MKKENPIMITPTVDEWQEWQECIVGSQVGMIGWMNGWNE